MLVDLSDVVQVESITGGCGNLGETIHQRAQWTGQYLQVGEKKYPIKVLLTYCGNRLLSKRTVIILQYQPVLAFVEVKDIDRKLRAAGGRGFDSQGKPADTTVKIAPPVVAKPGVLKRSDTRAVMPNMATASSNMNLLVPLALIVFVVMAVKS